MEIYQPSEDSHLFADFLKKELPKLVNKNKNLKFIEIGCGSGILLKTASKFLNKKNIWTCDINSQAVKYCKEKGFNAIQSNLFQAFSQAGSTEELHNTRENHQPKFSKVKFDLIIFNAPYLPLDTREPKSSQLATTGGKRGDEISLKFLKQAKQYLNKNGKIFLLISSLTPIDKIKKLWPHKIVARKKVFMEELLILKFN